MNQAMAGAPRATGPTIDARQLLSAEERARMISRVHSLVYWVGMFVPERELLGDSEIELREVVYNLTSKESPTPDDVREASDLIDQLRRKERELETSLSKDPMSVETAKGLLEEICGILRAIDELRLAESEDRAEFRKDALVKRVDDAKRWQKFMESIRPARPPATA